MTKDAKREPFKKRLHPKPLRSKSPSSLPQKMEGRGGKRRKEKTKLN